MLQSLYVKNLALIEEIEVEFGPGLNILSGETGAGKSIILGSIDLALGGRYSGDLLRKGAEYGLVELVFHIEKEELISALKEIDIFPENGILVLNRKLMPGKSISKINGETVTQSYLKTVASLLIDIHGQHEHQSLLVKKNHLEILDEYIGNSSALLRKNVEELHKKYKSKLGELEKADTDIESRNRELSFLSFELEEIENAQLINGEDDELEIQYKKMNNGKRIIESLDTVYDATAGYGGTNASDNLSRALQALQSATDYDEECLNFYNQLTEIDSLLNDFNRELSSYRANLDFSKEEFHEVESRLNTWNHLKGKYGQSYDLIMEYMESILLKIENLKDYDTYLDNLKAEIKNLKTDLLDASLKLSITRKKEALIFEKEIIKGLQELNFLDVRVKVDIQSSEEKINQTGIDDVGFLVALNPGEELKPLSGVVSGGELSRIMLIIKTVLSDKDNIETMIFDEVDAGISGITASKVGEKLAFIGSNRQVICITHLAQIASLADKHFIIEKQVHDGKTITNIAALSEEDSILELARILGGGQTSDAIMESAKELKNTKYIFPTQE